MKPVLYLLGILALFGLISACRSVEKINQDTLTPPDTLTMPEEQSRGLRKESELLALTYAQRKGKWTYDQYCAVCHGPEGRGDGFNAYNLEPRPKDFAEKGYLESITDEWLLEAISQGGRGVKRSALMPAYENTLTEERVVNVVAYLRYLSQNIEKD